MKRLFPLLLTVLVLTCFSCGSDSPDSTPEPEPTPTPTPTPDPGPEPATPHLLRGADISWYTEMAADGLQFFTPEGKQTPCPQLMKEIGMEAARLRVWVHPENRVSKYSDTDDVVAKARAAQSAGLDVMIDFHYSDWFADPGRQDMPMAWKPTSLSEAIALVADHTRSTLQALRDAGVEVRWVQTGNETRNGMLWPWGQLWNDKGDLPNGWNNFCKLVNAGYEAAKEVFPTATVMVHINHAYEDNAWWVERFLSHGGKTDAIAFSHYPMSDDTSKSWSTLNTLAIKNLRATAQKFGIPVMVSETGVNIADEALAKEVLGSFITALEVLREELEGSKNPLLGVFYWEPEVYGGWKPAWYVKYGWNAYDQGAFLPDGRPSPVLLQAFLGKQ